MTRVIKIGGRAQTDPALAEVLVDAVARDRIVVVHGGGDEVSTLQRRLGMTPRFYGGRRVTTPEDLDVVRMVLSGTANKRLVAMLVTAAINWRFQRDFARVWAESLRVKHPEPLGEDALVRRLREHGC